MHAWLVQSQSFLLSLYFGGILSPFSTFKSSTYFLVMKTSIIQLFLWLLSLHVVGLVMNEGRARKLNPKYGKKNYSELAGNKKKVNKSVKLPVTVESDERGHLSCKKYLPSEFDIVCSGSSGDKGQSCRKHLQFNITGEDISGDINDKSDTGESEFNIASNIEFGFIHSEINPNRANMTSSDEEADAEEIQKQTEDLLAVQHKLETRQKRAQAKADMQALQSKNARMEAECLNLESKNKAPFKKDPVLQQQAQDITMNTLRQHKELEERAQQQLRGIEQELDRDYFTDSDSDSSTSSTKKRGKPKHKRSGREVKAFDNVKVQLVWPHTQLRFQYINSKTKFNNLDLALLIAGETQHILSNSPPADEITGRLKLIQLVSYHSKTYQWQACLNFYGAVLLEIERGLRDWSNVNFQEIEAGTLYQYTLTKKFSSQNKSQQSSSLDTAGVLFF